MALPDLARDRIATVRWSGAPGDALRARRAVERALAAMDWGAASGDAIVCIRRLRGTLRGSGVTAGAARAWDESLRSLAAGAARPWREEVRADAQAIVFADQVELFACLARDAARGVATGCWWWPSLLGDVADARMLLRQWRGAPERVPAALQRLAVAGEAARVLDCLGEHGAAPLAQEVARVFGVQWRLDARAAGAQDARDAGLAWPGPLRADLGLLLRDVRSALGGTPPAAVPARAQLLAIALGLAGRPRLVRAPGFARAMAAALAGEPRTTALRSASAAPPAAHAPALDEQEPAPRERASAGLGAAVPQAAPPEAAQAQAAPVASAAAGAAASETSREAQVRAEARTGEGVLARATLAQPPARTSEPPGQGPIAAAIATPVPRAAAAGKTALPPPPRSCPPAAGLRVRSAFAGTLYLLPAAMHLGWYGDFTQPLAPGLALHPAELLALLGERLAGAEWAADELPVLLAAWAGRAPHEPAGAGFVPDDGLALGDWLAAREEALARRVAAALDRPAEGALQWLVRRPGLVVLTDGSVDARFDLAAHPLAIRLAGLDRDPGWVPAAGRAIHFHFDLGAEAA